MKYLLTLLVFFLLSLTTTGRAAERMTFDGALRTYEIHGATPGMPRPLILALHGNLGSGAQFERSAGWARVAARHGVVVALPDGLNRAWADGRNNAERKGRLPPAGTNDVAFVSALAEKLVADGIADHKRLYLAGVSNGGMMTYRLLCERPDLFAAGAAVIAVLTDDAAARCKPQRAVPLLVINGTADRLIPWSRSATYMGTEATLAHFRRLNGCGDTFETRAYPDTDRTDRSTVTRLHFTCPKGADVDLIRVDGGGHQWPSRVRPPRLELILGPANRDIEASEEIWAFLQRFSR